MNAFDICITNILREQFLSNERHTKFNKIYFAVCYIYEYVLEHYVRYKPIFAAEYHYIRCLINTCFLFNSNGKSTCIIERHPPRRLQTVAIVKQASATLYIQSKNWICVFYSLCTWNIVVDNNTNTGGHRNTLFKCAPTGIVWLLYYLVLHSWNTGVLNNNNMDESKFEGKLSMQFKIQQLCVQNCSQKRVMQKKILFDNVISTRIW